MGHSRWTTSCCPATARHHQDIPILERVVFRGSFLFRAPFIVSPNATLRAWTKAEESTASAQPSSRARAPASCFLQTDSDSFWRRGKLDS